MIKKIEEFKDRLNKALSLRDMRAVDVTAKTGISEATISQYRSGYAKPKSDKLQLLSDALDVNPTWLMGLDVPMVNPPIRIETGSDIVDFELRWAEAGGGEHPIPLGETEQKLIKL